MVGKEGVNIALMNLRLQGRGNSGWLLTGHGSKYGEQGVDQNTGRQYVRWKHEVAVLLGPEHFAPVLLTASQVGAQLTPRLSAQRLNYLLLEQSLQERRGANGWWLTGKGSRYGVQRGREDDPQPIVRWRQEVVECVQSALDGEQEAPVTDSKKLVKGMVRDALAGYALLELPNNEWAAFWEQALDDDEYTQAIAEGDYQSACAYIGGLHSAAVFIMQERAAMILDILTALKRR